MISSIVYMRQIEEVMGLRLIINLRISILAVQAYITVVRARVK